MKSNRSLLGVIGIVAAAVVIYFGFFNSPPSNDDLSATIGTVAKHQNEQITDADVVLAGEETSDWSDDPVVVEAMASILERATIAQRSAAFLATGRQAREDLLGKASPEIRAAALARVSPDLSVAAFKRVEKEAQEAMLSRVNLSLTAYQSLSLDRKAAAIASFGVKDRSQVLARVDKNVQMGAVAKIDPNYHSDILGRASKLELARIFLTAPELSRVDMFRDLPLNERQSLMGKVYLNSGNALLQRATPIELENLRNTMTEKHAASLYGAASVQDQLVWAGRAVKTAASSFETLGRAQKQDTMGRLYLGATDMEKVSFFRAQSVDVQNELYGKMNIGREAWNAMDMGAKAKALSSLPLERKAAMLARLDKDMIIDLAGRADPSIQKEFCASLSRKEMANALKLGASSREVFQALGRSPEIRAEVFNQVPVDVQIRMMGRAVRTSPIE